MIARLNCPVCSRPLPVEMTSADREFPFCSVRCRQIDLYRWSEGRYAIVEPVDADMVELLQEDPDISVSSDQL